ncbi:hypothetical protein FV139_05040 [Parahaliea maris]|uniref:Glucose/Sorbosone dehydrogenase domain-containing protein n=1 Tax=Parahaliea maris TaxID=2716870 RepID=A0A5C9A315_9GAMM|nr:PQQ-dependent sugar dehydrogenase [Parahaliea maris]TXS95265.1 hypothetical protein FV139_05040 [Parahaliea maris]
MKTRYCRTLLLLASMTALTACGGGGGSPDNPTPPPEQPPASDPFGLTERTPLADFNLPTTASGEGDFQLTRRFAALTFPSALFITAVPGEGRLLVVRQSGELEAFVDDDQTTESRTVLDLSDRLLFAGEQGLLGMAFDPDFVSNRLLYLHYSMDNPRRSVIARFRWDAATDLIALDSERILLEVAQPYANHNGGMLAFGPDDRLYIALGDGGSGGDPQNNAQNGGNLLGTILRLNVHPADPALPYAIPLDNPFRDNAAIRNEIWAYGLRNPFRFSFDRVTGLMWIGDVGQGAQEEINIARGGENFGWRVLEGTLPYDDSANTLPPSAFTAPVFEYGRDQGVAVIGGYVYRGNAIPGLSGRYIYTDFGSGNVWAITLNGQQVTGNQLIAQADSPTSLGEDSNGELYIVNRQGELFGFTQSGGENPPDQLSETGLFSSLDTLSPASGLIEYTVNLPFWSDNTVKRRWIAVPENAAIGFAPTGNWDFPIGTIAVKHFEILAREGDTSSTTRLETRVMVLLEQGWQAFTYRWNSAGTDATLLSGRQSEKLQVQTASGEITDQVYTYPSRTDCFRCHTAVAGRVLGIRTAQINTEFDYNAGEVTDNQLRSWNNIGLFTEDIGPTSNYPAYAAVGDDTASLEDRARAYLDVNCAQCHQSGGTTPAEIDLRFTTPLANTGLIDTTPLLGTLGIENGRLIAPGEPGRSILIARVGRRDAVAMPPLGSHLVDEAGVTLLRRWVESL